MENDTLVAYIATERARGVTDDNIHTELLTKGWGETEVLAALGGNIEEAAAAAQALPGVFLLLKETKDTFMKSLQFFTTISLVLVLPPNILKPPPDRKSTRLNSSHLRLSRMPSSA